LGDLVRATDSPALDIGSLFEANRPEVLAPAKRVMEKCVLEKIMPPTPPLGWNRKMPDYAHDMIAVAIKTEPLHDEAHAPRR
jgi:hypothetical protein